MCRICYIPQIPNNPLYFASSAIAYKDKYHKPGSIHRISILNAEQIHIEHVMKAAAVWSEYANINFEYTNDFKKGDIRITLNEGAGSWSYIGTDNKLINPDKPTMNLGWITQDILNHDLSTTLHEIGHYLGLGHEHQNPNKPFNWARDFVIQTLSGPPNFWSLDQIDHNVFRVAQIDQVDATTLDRNSIMMYFFPDSWVIDGKGTKQNKQLSALDKTFISLIYPKEIVKNVSYDTEMYIKNLLYEKRRIDFLNKKQVTLTLDALQEYYDPRDSTRFLKNKLKSFLHD